MSHQANWQPWTIDPMPAITEGGPVPTETNNLPNSCINKDHQSTTLQVSLNATYLNPQYYTATSSHYKKAQNFVDNETPSVFCLHFTYRRPHRRVLNKCNVYQTVSDYCRLFSYTYIYKYSKNLHIKNLLFENRLASFLWKHQCNLWCPIPVIENEWHTILFWE